MKFLKVNNNFNVIFLFYFFILAYKKCQDIKQKYFLLVHSHLLQLIYGLYDCFELFRNV